MSRNLKISIAAVVTFVAVIAVALLLSGRSSDTAASSQPQSSPSSAEGGTAFVRADSHRLSTAPDGKVTLVEFLDFECESCRAAYPSIENLRQEYAGRVTFVARYFPLPGHFNADNAALAVEAAAQQGKFEAMYKKMYETQTEWGEQRVSAAPLFRQFAQEMGLDMAKYDAAVASPATLERVRADQRDGEALGVQGTPTFFLNGTKITPRSEAEMKAQIDAALAS